MEKLLRLTLVFGVGILTVLLATGCLGPQVLQERTEHMPATDPQAELRLMAGKPADVLIIYDDQNPKTLKVKRRAFYLFANYERVMHGKRPRFVPAQRGEALAKIPAFQKHATNAPAPAGDLYAVFDSPREFRLLSRDKEIAEFGLPEFGDWLTVKKLLLFPGAVAADAVGLTAAGGAAAAVSNPVGTAEVITAVAKGRGH